MTHTVSELEISFEAFNEIRNKLVQAGYAPDEGSIDMGGIAIVAAAPSAPARYFVYDHDGGYNEFKTDAERERAHQEAIDGYLDSGCDGWSEEVTCVVSGIVTHKTVKTDEETRPEPCAEHPDHDGESCDACEAWSEWPNHDFETVCRYEPAPLRASASVTDSDGGAA